MICHGKYHRAIRYWMTLGLIWGSLVALAAPVAAQGAPLRVAAAANLSSVGSQLSAAFAQLYPAYRLEFAYGASGALTTQIQNGAPFDLFLSADVEFPAKLSAGGFTTGEPTIYAQGRLILLSSKPLDFKRGLAVLTDPAIKQFAIANPATAPYGRAAQEALRRTGLWEAVSAKAVYAQTINQAVQYTLGATGIGFVNKSALTSPEGQGLDREGLFWLAIDTSNSPLDQAYVVLKAATNPSGAKAFVAFLASPAARAIMTKAGYVVPQ